MPRNPCFIWLLPLFLLTLSLSCVPRPVSEAVEMVEEAVPVALPPYRMVLVSSREVPAILGLPVGMVMGLQPGSGRMNASSSTWKALVDLTEDDTVRAVVVADAPQGTAALFAELKELRPELLLLALSPVESPLVIQASADIVIDFDHVARAYSAVLLAARMGRSSMMVVSTPGGNDDWRSTTRQAVLQVAGADMGIDFKPLVAAPDNLGKALHTVGIAVGMDTAAAIPTEVAARMVIVVNDGWHGSEALRLAEASGALFIELDRPVDGYAGIAAEVVLATVQTSTLASVPTGEDSVRSLIDTARNVPGRPGLTLVWPGEQPGLLELGALAFARSIIDGRPASEVGLAKVMNVVWPTGQWHASHFVDPQTGVRARNHMVIGSDPYLAGRSYLSAESGQMPLKYRMAPW